MIAGISYYHICQFFLVYSFLGWCVEVIYQAAAKGKIVNRGFLNGPVCPIYGFGVLAVFGTINAAEAYFDAGTQKTSLLLVFVCGIALTTSIELFGGWALDRIFHARWWDYTDKPFNFHGYICLEFSLLWGLGIVLVVEVVHPLIASILNRSAPQSVGWPLMGILYTVYAADFMLSVMIMVGLNKRLAELDEMQKKMRVVSNKLIKDTKAAIAAINKLSKEIGRGALETAQHVGEARVQAALATAEARDTLSAAKDGAIGSLNAAKAGAIEGISAATVEAIDSLQAAKAGAIDSLSAAKDGIQAGISDAHSTGEKRMAALKKIYDRRTAALIRMVRRSRYFGLGRLLRAFPQMEHRDYKELLETLKKSAEKEEDSE